jgi:colanic acid/amylovoran biosynthesis protein
VKVVISHAYSRFNKGDAALVSVLVDEVTRTFRPTDLVVLTMDETSPGETIDGTPLESDFIYYASTRYGSKLPKLLYTTMMFATTCLWAFAFRHSGRDLWLPRPLRRLMRRYAAADLVIPVGGGYLRGSTRLDSIFNLALLLHPIVLTTLLDKPTVLFSQSVGPFSHAIERTMLRVVLNASGALILVREDKSLALLHDLRIRNAVRSVDAGFLFDSGDDSDLRAQLGLDPDRLLIGVTVRHWLDDAEQQRYQDACVQMIDHVIERHDADVVFIPQVTAKLIGDDDRSVSRAVLGGVHHEDRVHLIEDDVDHHQVKAMYADLDLLVGTRFHSVIFALTSSVPAVAIEYEHKTSGIMADLELDKWVIKMEDVTGSRLIACVDDLMAQTDAYRAQLDLLLPDYVDRARQAIVLTEQFYRASRDEG